MVTKDDFAWVAKALGLPWPDVSVDALISLSTAFINFGGDVEILGYPIHGMLRQLNQANSSKALQGLENHWDQVQKQYLNPFDGACQQISRYVMDAVDIIEWYKTAVLSAVDINAGFGLMAVAREGEAALVGLVDRKAAARIARAEAEKVMGEVKARLNSEVTSQIKRIADDLAGDASRAAAIPEQRGITALIDGIASTGVARSAAAEAQAIAGHLHVSVHDVEQMAGRIVAAFDNCSNSGGELKAAIDQLAHPHAVHGEPDPSIRTFLHEFFSATVNDVVQNALATFKSLLTHQSGLVTLVGDQINQVDQQLAVVAHNNSGVQGSAIPLQAAAGGVALAGGTVVATWKTAPKTVASTATADYVAGPQHLSNSAIAAAAEAELKNEPGALPTGWNASGECMVSAQRWVKEAGGKVNPNGEVAGSYQGVAVQVPMKDVQRGDIIQYVDPNNPNGNWDHVHTVVVTGVNSDGSLQIIERNYDFKGGIRQQTNWRPAPAQGWVADVFRYGDTP